MGVIARQSIKGAAANYAGVAIGFVTTFFVVTRMLSAEEVGLTRMMVDAAMLFSALAQLGSCSSVIKFFPHFAGRNAHHSATADTGQVPLDHAQHPYHGLFGWSLVVPLVGFALFVLLFALFRTPLTNAYTSQAPLLAGYLYMLPMLTFFTLYISVFEANASVLMRITIPKLVREVGIRLFNLAAYLLYGFGVVSLDGFVWLFCGSYGLALLLDVVYIMSITGFNVRLFAIERGFVDRRLAGEVVRYTLFVTVTALAANVPLFNSLFVGAKTGAAMAGVYAIASYIAAVVDIPYRSLGAIARPVVAVAVKENNWAEVNRLGQQVSLHQMIVSLCILFAIWINLEALFSLLPNGQVYARGTWVVLLLGLVKVATSSLSIATDVLNYSAYYGWGLLFIGVLTGASLLLNPLLIDLCGLEGTAYATLAAYALYLVPMIVFLARKTGFNPFSMQQLKMAIIALAMFAVGAAWQRWLTPAVGLGTLADAVVRNIVLLPAMALAIYRWQVSATVNNMVHKTIQAIKQHTHRNR